MPRSKRPAGSPSGRPDAPEQDANVEPDFVTQRRHEALSTYIIYFRFTKPGEKKPGPITHYKVMARDVSEARDLARQYGNYPGFEIVEILEA